MRRVLLEVAGRMQDNYPYFHPQYAGQMLKPPHAIARLAYSLAMYVNPNNPALDGSRASSPMEKEAVARYREALGRYGLTGFPETWWVDRAGRLVAYVQGEFTQEQLDANIEKALKPS